MQAVTLFSGCSSNRVYLTVAEKVPVCSFRCVGFVNKAECQQQAQVLGTILWALLLVLERRLHRAGTVVPCELLCQHFCDPLDDSQCKLRSTEHDVMSVVGLGVWANPQLAALIPDKGEGFLSALFWG